MKIKFIESLVSTLEPILSLKINMGDRHRIMKSGWKGSMWVTQRASGYRVHITGDVEKHLTEDLEALYGKCNGIDLGYPYWYVDDKKDVVEIIEIYANKNLSDDFSKDKFILITNKILKDKLNKISLTERDSIVTSRIGQDVLREMILKIYNNTCAMCEIDDERLLRASHIAKWSKDEKNRLNPQNVLCLCGLHDLAFENGIISIDDNYEILINTKYQKTFALLKQVTLKKLRLPKHRETAPDKKLLSLHRNSFPF